jgi:hypothetical protein
MQLAYKSDGNKTSRWKPLKGKACIIMIVFEDYRKSKFVPNFASRKATQAGPSGQKLSDSWYGDIVN